jgi:hypothetical protein
MGHRSPLMRHAGCSPAIILCITLALCLCIRSIAHANPVPDPDRVAKHVVGTVILVGVIISLLFVESCLTFVLLLFAGLSGVPLLGALGAINAISYLLVLLPLLHVGVWVILAEAAVVPVEASLIKLVGCFEIFQGDRYGRLTWRYAFLVSLVGNAFSYGLGRTILG